MMSNPTPCRFVLYHFRAPTADDAWEERSRPAVVTSVGASSDVLNLFVFFEADDWRYGGAFALTQPHRHSVHPRTDKLRVDCWSYPPPSA